MLELFSMNVIAGKENPGGSVNYWDTWYLGFELGKPNTPSQSQRFRKLPREGAPRTGSYKTLVAGGHDLTELHALMAPRPVLVSGGTADQSRTLACLESPDIRQQAVGLRESRCDDQPRYSRSQPCVQSTDLRFF